MTSSHSPTTFWTDKDAHPSIMLAKWIGKTALKFSCSAMVATLIYALRMAWGQGILFNTRIWKQCFKNSTATSMPDFNQRKLRGWAKEGNPPRWSQLYMTMEVTIIILLSLRMRTRSDCWKFSLKKSAWIIWKDTTTRKTRRSKPIR